MWKYYALLSALFAAITSILAKVGVKGISGNLATAIRTIVILFMAWGIVLFSGQWKELKDISKKQSDISGVIGYCNRPFLDILFQGA